MLDAAPLLALVLLCLASVVWGIAGLVDRLVGLGLLLVLFVLLPLATVVWGIRGFVFPFVVDPATRRFRLFAAKTRDARIKFVVMVFFCALVVVMYIYIK